MRAAPLKQKTHTCVFIHVCIYICTYIQIYIYVYLESGGLRACACFYFVFLVLENTRPDLYQGKSYKTIGVDLWGEGGGSIYNILVIIIIIMIIVVVFYYDIYLYMYIYICIYIYTHVCINISLSLSAYHASQYENHFFFMCVYFICIK